MKILPWCNIELLLREDGIDPSSLSKKKELDIQTIKHLQGQHDQQSHGNEGNFSEPLFKDASFELAQKLNEEWNKTYPKESEGPFWNVEGEKNSRYWEVRDDSGKIVAGATTVQKGASTEILSIGSHAQGQGKEILNILKDGNIFLIVLASSNKSKKWFLDNGFSEVRDKPGQYNVRWKRPQSYPKSLGLQSFKHLQGQHNQQSHAGVPSNFSETKFVDGQRVISDGSPLPEYLAQNKVRIPPVWTEVIVSRDLGNGLWVKGHDAKGRHQSVYSPEFIKLHAQAKFARVLEMAKKFDRIDKENTDNMKSKDSEIREASSVMKLIMVTGIRPGSEKDTGAEKRAYGATTLEGRHVISDEKGVRLEFVGKKGVSLSIPIANKEVADMVLQRAKSAGKNGKLFNVDDDKLRDYTHTLDGGKFKTKDFRTLLATKTAIDKIKEYGDRKPSNQKEYKRMVREVATEVSRNLGNTPTVALQSYINPIVFKAWRGSFAIASVGKRYGLVGIIKHLSGQYDQQSHGGGVRNKANELFHETSTELIGKIKKEGIIDPANRKIRIFATGNLRTAFTYGAARDKNSVILDRDVAVFIIKSAKLKLHPSGYYFSKENIPPEEILSVRLYKGKDVKQYVEESFVSEPRPYKVIDLLNKKDGSFEGYYVISFDDGSQIGGSSIDGQLQT